MSKRRYSVWNNVRFAIGYGPDYETWHAAKEEVDACRQDWFDQSRIWDHSTTPPTDVTDADPEAEAKCEQMFKAIAEAARTGEVGEFSTSDGDRYRVTVERIEPEPEEPQWWCWDMLQHPPRWRSTSVPGPICSNNHVVVYGTTADRDAKRDALLAAAKAAGKGGEG